MHLVKVDSHATIGLPSGGGYEGGIPADVVDGVRLARLAGARGGMCISASVHPCIRASVHMCGAPGRWTRWWRPRPRAERGSRCCTGSSARVHVCMCACACVRMCMCAHVHVCACACVRMCMCAHVHVCACACVRMCMCAHGGLRVGLGTTAGPSLLN